MKKIFLLVIASISVLRKGCKVPKDNNVGYLIISGCIANSEQAGKYFSEVNNVVFKSCRVNTLTVDYETDVRQGI